MKLTALEIKQQSFAKSIRGFDVAEVQSFLNIVSNEWEHMSNKIRDQEHEIKRLTEKLQHYQKVEEALHETLQAAKESAEQRVNSSKEESRNRIAKAELEAEKIVRDAQKERQTVRQSIQRLLERRHEIIRGMESYLDLATESLNSFKRDDSSIYSLPEGEKENTAGKASDSSRNTGKNSPDSISGSDEKSASKATSKTSQKAASPTPGADDLDDMLDDLDE